MDTVIINHLFLIGAMLIAVSVILSPLALRFGIPILVIFLGVGILAGVDGVGKIVFEDYTIAYTVGNLALAIILLNGGLNTKLSSFRIALWPALSLSTFGVAITTVLTGVVAAFLFNISLLEGLLIGAIVGSTDAAVVFSLLGGKNLNARVSSTLEIESGSNDPMAVFLTVSIIELLQLNKHSIDAGVFIDLIQQFGLGTFLGYAGGYAVRKLVNTINVAEGLYSVLIAGSGVFIYAITNTVGGSGILAIYITGIVLGNLPLRDKYRIKSMLDGLAWLGQVAMFIVLGLLLTPSKLLTISAPSILLAVFMMIVARPVAVFVSLLPFSNFNISEKLFLSWIGLRGAVPIILAVFPLMAGLENADLFFNVAFFIVLMSLFTQGTTIGYASARTYVEIPPKPAPLSTVGIEAYKASEWEMYIYEIEDDNHFIGQELQNVELPEDTKIAAVFRDKQLMRPLTTATFRKGDTIAVIGQEIHLPKLSKMFSQEIDAEQDVKMLGDLMLSGDTTLASIITFYGIEAENPNLKLSQVFASFNKQYVVGDQIEYKGVLMSVAELDGDRVSKVGLFLSKM